MDGRTTLCERYLLAHERRGMFVISSARTAMVGMGLARIGAYVFGQQVVVSVASLSLTLRAVLATIRRLYIRNKIGVDSS